MASRVNRRAKALHPSESVKQAVYARDRGLCVWCGKPGLPEAHYIGRFSSGMGVEQNILTLCRECHEKYDRGPREMRERMEQYFAEYLKACYPGWNESDLIYRRF